jgi:hypothetical protein
MNTDDLENENGDLRQLLFLYHRSTQHCMPFEIGSEMQCGDVDFERDPIEKLSAHLSGKAAGANL